MNEKEEGVSNTLIKAEYYKFKFFIKAIPFFVVIFGTLILVTVFMEKETFKKYGLYILSASVVIGFLVNIFVSKQVKKLFKSKEQP
ncbi:hypothetical protein CMO88_01945 [Candidatus Woesearchaeota archaeon]|nr:hypothetical protein [Candidatus Woesearchaeota archaeon]|tara:strand:- start:4906 stop:5163 length:258 start_codon:yes stop_codon:yes gene_type:complete